MSGVITLRFDVNGSSFLCRTFENAAIQLSKIDQDLDFIESGQGQITEQRFRIPLEEQTLLALGDAGNPGATPNIDIRKRIPGSIIVDGSPVARGSFLITQFDYDPKSRTTEVDLIFKGNETDLKAELSDVKLSTLLQDETIPYTGAEIKSYYDDPETYISTNGYSWDLIDYGQDFYVNGGTGGKRIDDSTNPLTQLDFKPQITVQKILDLIDSELGIEITTEGIDDLVNQVMPLHNNESTLPTLDTSINDYTGYMDRTVSITYTDVIGGGSSLYLMNFNNAVNYNQVVFNVGVGNDYYLAQVDGIHSFKLFWNLNVATNSVAASNQVNVLLQAYKNGVFEFGIESYFIFLNAGGNRDVAGEYSFNSLMSIGDNYRIYITVANAVGSAGSTATVTQQTSTTFSCTQSPAFTSTSNVLVGSNVNPDLTCYDVVKTLISQCNGRLERTLTGYNIVPWVTWIEEGTDNYIVDQRLEDGKTVSIEPTGVTGAKSIRFKYKESEDFYNKKYTELTNKQYGELFIKDTGTDFSTEEYELEVPFGVGVPVRIDGSSATIIKYIDENGEVINDVPKLLPRQSVDFGPFSFFGAFQSIYIKDYFSGTAELYNILPQLNHWTDGSGFQGNDGHFGSSLTFFASSGYPNNTLYERFWRPFIRETYGQLSKKVTASIKLSSTEFKRLVLNEKFYYQNRLFRCIEVKNYDLSGDETVSVNLIQRIPLLNSDIAPYYPNNVDVRTGVVNWFDSSDNSNVGDGSGEPAADIEASCIAYGFFYDSNANVGIQRGRILET